MKTLVWLRNDLRLWDNPALFRAAELGEGVAVVYLLCEEFLVRHAMAPVKLDFIRRHLLLLATQLADRNISVQLLVTKNAAEIPTEILSAARKGNCEQVYFNAEYPLDELNRDHAVADLLREQGLLVKRFHDRVVVPPGMIRNGQGEPYKVFTAFKRKWLQTVAPLNLTPLPAPATQPGMITKKSKASKTTDDIESTISQIFSAYNLRDLSAIWPAGDGEAHQRLKDFIEQDLPHYKNKRDFPALEGTSTLSPYLTVGAISPRQCLAAVLAANGGEWDSGSEGASCWIGELIWREFYQHVVVDFPEVCKHQPMKKHTDGFPWKHDPALFTRWCEGTTGIPLVDAAMRQLNQTGWMHNRLRMVVAMFLTKNLQIDWRLGEHYFMTRLIDGDFAANNGGWQWSASTGTDAAPYFRIFNPVSQSQRFDPDGSFIRNYLPELAHLPAKQIHMPPANTGYPPPVVDLTSSRKHTITLFAQLKN